MSKDRALTITHAILKRHGTVTQGQRRAAVLWGDSLLAVQIHPSDARVAEELRLRSELGAVLGLAVAS